VPAKKPDDKGKPKRAAPAKHDAHTAEVAFDEVIDAILGADPDAVREHQANRRKRKARKGRSASG